MSKDYLVSENDLKQISDLALSVLALPLFKNKKPIFQLEIKRYDTPNIEWSGWTWYLTIGDNQYQGLDPTPGYLGLKAQSSPHEAYLSFLKWTQGRGKEIIQSLS